MILLSIADISNRCLLLLSDPSWSLPSVAGKIAKLQGSLVHVSWLLLALSLHVIIINHGYYLLSAIERIAIVAGI
jgi:hypothetical protein